jgi:hypothetical protein
MEFNFDTDKFEVVTIIVISVEEMNTKFQKYDPNMISLDSLINHPITEKERPVGVIKRAFWEDGSLKVEAILWKKMYKNSGVSFEIMPDHLK